MTTAKYGLYNVEFSVQGWDTIMNNNMDIIEEKLHTNLRVVAGETIAQYEAVGLFRGETKYKKARADGRLQPCQGIALTAAVLDDNFNIQRVGLIINVSWSWTPGRPVFLDPSVSGGLTQSPSGPYTQYIGFAESATELHLSIDFGKSALATTTTTTTTTSSTTTTTTA